MGTKQLNLGVVGATGMVGEEFLKILKARNFPVGELRLFASDNSVNKKISFGGKEILVQSLSEKAFAGLDLVFFSSGDAISKTWAPLACRDGAFAVDNSAAFRMSPEVPLVVPEVNGELLKKLKSPTIIANPNCSTIQLVMALAPLEKAFGVSKVFVATYQAVSGAGKIAREELLSQIHAPDASPVASVFPHPIAFNVIPQIGSFSENGFCTEEEKIMAETKKILSKPNLSVSAFTVRVPTLNSHCEAAWVTVSKTVERRELLGALKKMPGLEVYDESNSANYPLATYASGKDPVYVGRIHRSLDDEYTWLMWIVADNLRKGAALNGVQIAERIFDLESAP